MITPADLFKNITARDRALLSSDGTLTEDSTVLQDVIDRSYEYVLSFVRNIDPNITAATLPSVFDDAILQLSKYLLFVRSNVIRDDIRFLKEQVDSFLQKVASGKVSVLQTPPPEFAVSSGRVEKNGFLTETFYVE